MFLQLYVVLNFLFTYSRENVLWHDIPHDKQQLYDETHIHTKHVVKYPHYIFISNETFILSKDDRGIQNLAKEIQPFTANNHAYKLQTPKRKVLCPVKYVLTPMLSGTYRILLDLVDGSKITSFEASTIIKEQKCASKKQCCDSDPRFQCSEEKEPVLFANLKFGQNKVPYLTSTPYYYNVSLGCKCSQL